MWSDFSGTLDYRNCVRVSCRLFCPSNSDLLSSSLCSLLESKL